jgi:hypothetical protein
MTEAEIRLAAQKLELEERLSAQIRKKIAEEDRYSESFKKSGSELLKSFGSLAGSLNDGTQGLAAYNSAISTGTTLFNDQLASLGKFGDGIKVVFGSIGIYAELVNKQTDALAKSYQDISTVGASSKDGFQGVFNTMQKFGLGIAELPKFNSLVKENAESLALFGGTVGQGLRAFANLTEGIQRTGLQTELLNMGLSVDSINKGLGGFLKTTTMLGNSQRLLSMTGAEQAKAAADYIKQQDIITKLTGKTAEQQQKSLEQAMSNDRYAAYRYMQERKLDELKATGQKEAAAQLEAQLKKEETIRNAFEGDAQKGIQDVIANAGSQTKEGVAMQIQLGATINSIKNVNKGAGESLAEMRVGMTRFLDQYAPTTNQVGQLAIATSTNEAIKFARGGATAASETNAQGQQKRQIEATENTLANYNAVIQQQIDITRNFQNTIQFGMQPMTRAMNISTEVILGLSSLLPGSKGMSTVESTDRGNTEYLKKLNAQTNLVNDSLMETTAIPAIEKNVKDKVNKVKEVVGGMVNSMSDITVAGTRLGDAATSAGDAVTSAKNSIVSQFKRMGDQLLDIAPSLRTPAAGQTANLAAGQVAAMLPISLQTSMASLIADMRRSTGPNNNYNPALTDTKYTPPINREEETARSNATEAAAQYNKEQIMAITNMSGKLDEMIGLLSRSVGIQDKTLRVAYNT